jgi:hypothetical protein
MTDINVKVTVPPQVVVKVTAGGPAGQPGPPGADGVDGDGSFYHEFVQAVPATEWTVHHALHRYPNVQVILTDGTLAWGVDIDHLSVDEFVVRFEEPIAGRTISS